MTERKRLTELLKTAKLCSYPFGEQYSDATIEKIADYLLANGVIVPPCKVGGVVYRVVEMGTGIRYRQVGRYETSSAKGYKIVPCIVPCEEKIKRFIRSVVVTKNNFYDVCESFGKTVFLTKEEAEKALAEKQGKDEGK